MKRLLFLFAVLCSLCTWAQQHPSWRIAKPQQSEKWLGVMSESQANPLPTRSVGVLGTPAKAPEAVAAPQGEPYTYALTNINVSQAGMISVSGGPTRCMSTARRFISATSSVRAATVRMR